MIRVRVDRARIRYEDLPPAKAAANLGLRQAAKVTVPVEHPELGTATFEMRVELPEPAEASVLHRHAMNELRAAHDCGDIELATAQHWVDAFLAHAGPTAETQTWVDALNVRLLASKAPKPAPALARHPDDESATPPPAA